MRRKLLVLTLMAAVLLAVLVPSATAATGISLLVPQSTAFTYLGHSCGGIQEQAFATGFDPVSGDPVGNVYLQTRCGGSGRGGGYRVTTYSAWVSVTWDFAGNAMSTAPLSGSPIVDPAFTATNGGGATVTNVLTAVNVAPSNCTVSNTTYCTYRAYLSANLPAAPTGVAATQVAGQVQVSWVPDPATAAAITSSTITATPAQPAGTAVTATVSGPATSALIALAPSTTYQITVVSTDAAGSSAPSSPITFTTAVTTVTPPPPSSVTAWWTGQLAPGPSLGVRWTAASAGANTIDQYEVKVTWTDGDNPGGTYSQTVSGATLSAYFAVDNTSNWSIQVRSHDAAGWGAWSRTITIGGV